MKFILRSALLMVGMALCVTYAPNDCSGATKEYYEANGVCVTASAYWKPYSYLDRYDQPRGALIDFWEKWSEKTGVPVRFKLVTWKETIELIRSGECDIHSGMYHTEAREKIFAFSQTFYTGTSIKAVRSNDDCSRIPEQGPFGAVNKTFEDQYLRLHHPEAEIITYRDTLSMLKNLSLGEVRAVVVDFPSFSLVAKELKLRGALKACDTVFTRDVAAAVNKGNDVLVDLVNEGVSQITEREKQMLMQRWFVVDSLTPTWRTEVVLGVLVVLVLSVGVWLISSRGPWGREDSSGD